VNDLIRAIRKDHASILDKADDLAQHYSRWPLGEHAAGRALHELVVAESRHESAEAQVLWPLVRDLLGQYRDIAEVGREQERDARWQLHRLHKARGTPASAEMVPAIVGAVRTHVGLEESQILPALASTLSRKDSLRLGPVFEAALRCAPSRPHPRLPAIPGLLAATAPLARRSDRMRDLLRLR
jgi:hypothetical protein